MDSPLERLTGIAESHYFTRSPDLHRRARVSRVGAMHDTLLSSEEFSLSDHSEARLYQITLITPAITHQGGDDYRTSS